VDDHSTDGTGELARAAGATVVTPGPLPPGWLGKPWACAAGAARATGALVLFTDADTVHAPGSLGAAVARLRADGAGLLTVIPTHEVEAPWEHLQGPFQLLLLVATGARAHGGGERAFAIGQYLLWDRATYDALGGHAPFAARVAEDLAMSAAVRARGGRVSLLFAPGLLRVRMYPEGLRAFVRGWRRNVREGLAAAGPRGVLETSLVLGWLLGLPVQVLQVLEAGPGWAGAAGLLALAATVAAVARRQRALGPFAAPSALAYPLSLGVFVWVTLLALSDRVRRLPVAWRGRVVDVRGAGR
jgi:4,4'-diaponeurosporenoate glycosyltransferase